MVERVIDSMVAQIPWPSQAEYDSARQNPRIRESMKERATEQAKSTMAIWKVAKQEKIKVEHKAVHVEIDAQIAKIEAQQPMTDQQKKDYTKSRHDSIEEQLLLDQAMEFLINNAKISEKKS